MVLSNKHYLWIVYINVALYATCYQLQRPLEPFLVEKLTNGNGAVEYAKLQSFFSALQTAGSLLTGYILDHYSAKVGFLISFAGSALCYAILSQATTLNILFLSKIPGIFQAGFLCAQLAAAQIATSDTERTTVLGRLTMSYTIGTIIGPTVGGLLGSTGDYYFGAKLAVVGSLISCILTLLLPNNSNLSTSPAKAKTIDTAPDKYSIVKVVINIIKLVWLVLVTKVVTSMANAMGQATYPIILLEQFKFDETKMGLSMSVMSILNGLVNGILLDPIISLCKGDLTTVIECCLICLTFLAFLQAFVTSSLFSMRFGDDNNLVYYLASTFGMSIAQYVMATSLTGTSTSRVNPSDKGMLLGIEHSLFAVARIFAPVMGVQLLTDGGISLVASACGTLFGCVTLLWNFNKMVLKVDSEKAEEERKGR